MADTNVTAPTLPLPASVRDTSGLHGLGYYTDEELAKILGKTRRALWEDRKRRQGLPYVKFGKAVLYRIDAVRHFLASLEQRPFALRTPTARKPRRVKKKKES